MMSNCLHYLHLLYKVGHFTVSCILYNVALTLNMPFMVALPTHNISLIYGHLATC